MKWYIKFLKDIGAFKKDAIVELDSLTAQAYIDTGAAEKSNGPDNLWVEFIEPVNETLTKGLTIELPAAEARAFIAAKKAKAAAEPQDVAKLAERIASKVLEANAAQVKVANAEFLKSVVDELDKRIKATSAQFPGNNPQLHVGDANVTFDKKLGFKTPMEFVHAVKNHYTAGFPIDKHPEGMKVMLKAPTTFMSEATGADGGFLLPPEFSEKLERHSFGQEGIFQRTRKFTTTSSNNLIIPKDETTPWGSTGVQVGWQAEMVAQTQSKGKFGQTTLQLHRLGCLVPVSNEMMEDSFTGIADYIASMAGDRINWKLEDAIVNGTGVAQPLGYATGAGLTGAALQQAKTSGQAASTISITNLAQMLGAVQNESMNNLCWLIHPSAFHQIVILTNGNQSLYIPAGGVQGQRAYAGTLFGIPLIMSSHAATLSSVGDIQLVDLSQYIGLTKGQMEAAMSIHLYFDSYASVFRFNLRYDGRPLYTSPITLPDGTTKVSAFVLLQNR